MTDTVKASGSASMDQGTTNSPDIDTNDYTFLYAVKPSASGGSQRTLAEMNQAGDHHFALILNGSDELTCFGTGVGYAWTLASVVGSWWHWGQTRASSTSHSWVIGEGFNQGSPSWSINQDVGLQNSASATNHHYIWIFGGASLDSDGRLLLGHVLVWNRALNSTELASEMKHRAHQSATNLHSELDCDATSGIGTDISGGGKDYTTSGSFASDASEPSDWAGGGGGGGLASRKALLGVGMRRPPFPRWEREGSGLYVPRQRLFEMYTEQKRRVPVDFARHLEVLSERTELRSIEPGERLRLARELGIVRAVDAFSSRRLAA